MKRLDPTTPTLEAEHAVMKAYLAELRFLLQHGRRRVGGQVRLSVDELETKIESILTHHTIRGYDAYTPTEDHT